MAKAKVKGARKTLRQVYDAGDDPKSPALVKQNEAVARKVAKALARG